MSEEFLNSIILSLMRSLKTIRILDDADGGVGIR
jgi:hypothetical protein